MDSKNNIDPSLYLEILKKYLTTNEFIILILYLTKYDLSDLESFCNNHPELAEKIIKIGELIK